MAIAQHGCIKSCAASTTTQQLPTFQSNCHMISVRVVVRVVTCGFSLDSPGIENYNKRFYSVTPSQAQLPNNHPPFDAIPIWFPGGWLFGRLFVFRFFFFWKPTITRTITRPEIIWELRQTAGDCWVVVPGSAWSSKTVSCNSVYFDHINWKCKSPEQSPARKSFGNYVKWRVIVG